MDKITVLIPCYNNQDLIRDCLESVKWADEILICDSFSTDKTLEIAKEYTDRIIQHEYINSAKQKNWAIPQANNEWVLIVDTDERISSELKQEIKAVVQNSQDKTGFKIPRANFSFGKRLYYGGYWPDYQLRLFLKSKAVYQPKEVHSHINLQGECGMLTNPILHYHDRTVSQVIDKYFIRYAKWEAEEKLKRENFNYKKLFTKPIIIFFYRYIILQGFRDGFAGFISANIWGIYSFFSYLYMRELQKVKLLEKQKP
ncbi:MAG: glycosyltransferase family 2 protein [Candidatus Omnitrophica bacterium]|nr:glycosyltransferase family 2 protein [Candidatus Omnitrophota bacterium]